VEFHDPALFNKNHHPKKKKLWSLWIKSHASVLLYVRILFFFFIFFYLSCIFIVNLINKKHFVQAQCILGWLSQQHCGRVCWHLAVLLQSLHTKTTYNTNFFFTKPCVSFFFFYKALCKVFTSWCVENPWFETLLSPPPARSWCSEIREVLPILTWFVSCFCLAIIQNTVLYEQELRIGWTHN